MAPRASRHLTWALVHRPDSLKAIRAHSTSDLPTHTQIHTLLLKKGGEVRGFGHKMNIRGNNSVLQKDSFINGNKNRIYKLVCVL